MLLAGDRHALKKGMSNSMNSNSGVSVVHFRRYMKKSFICDGWVCMDHDTTALK